MVRLLAPVALIICTIPALGRGLSKSLAKSSSPKASGRSPAKSGSRKVPGSSPAKSRCRKASRPSARSPKTAAPAGLAVVADALFEFDKANLNPAATETLAALGPEIEKTGAKPIAVEGHTDALGSDAYNQKLSEARAKSVRDWLAEHQFVPATLAIKGYGKTRPVAANQKPDGSDDPEGRQKNRRVEVVVSACS